MGPNGAGKTTTVGMAVGLIKPDAGRILPDSDGDPAKPEVRKKIGLAPQILPIYENLTARENLAFFGRIQGLSGAKLRNRVTWTLDFAGLTDRVSDRIKNYSGGILAGGGILFFVIGSKAFRWSDKT